MLNFLLQQHSRTPLYLQIVEQIKQRISSGELKPGAMLPAIRQMAQSLNVNQNTVLKAYLILENERVIVAKRGVGTLIAKNINDPELVKARQSRLSSIINNDLIDVLSLGYSPEEVEAAFQLNLSLWKQSKQAFTKNIAGDTSVKDRTDFIRFVGSNDIALNILLSWLKKRNYNIEIINAGSLSGLIALQEERSHIAGTHLYDEETGEYNLPYIKRILPGRKVIVINLAHRIQGLMFNKDNPKKIRGLADLKRPDVLFINRQKGSGTRVLLDIQLKKMCISGKEINGYDREEVTHLGVGLSISRNKADTGLGIEAAARICNLEFLPLFKERYDLVMIENRHQSKLLSSLLETVGSREFHRLLERIGGYDTTESGKTMILGS